MLVRAPARAAPCETATLSPGNPDEAAALAEARAYAQAGQYAEARAIYRWLVARDPRDREARLGLSRVDAWQECFDRAEPRYRALLDEIPSDVEARAGLIDLLMWSERWDEARTQLDRGLSLSPNAPELWQRRARYLQWSGERSAAVDAIAQAERLAPNDPDIREFRDRLFDGQLRAALRIDHFPRLYPDLFTATLSGQQYWHQLEFGLDAQTVARLGGADHESIVDGLYTATGIYHFHGGTSLGASLGLGAPARAIPAFTAKTWLLAQIGSRWSAYFAYAFWQYQNDKSAHIFAPALGYALSDRVQLELRWWTSLLVLDRPMQSANTALVNAVSGRVMWRVLTPVTIGMSYTYGPQLDQAPARYEFLRLISHVFNLYGDWLITRRFGITPLFGFEHRHSANGGSVALIYSTELAAYVRW